MELNTGYSSVLRAWGLLLELARHGIDGADFGTSSGILIAQLFKVILEHIDDFIWLELLLNSGSDAIDECIEAFREFGIIFDVLCSLANKILSIVCCNGVDTTIVVGLRLVVYHAMGCL